MKLASGYEQRRARIEMLPLIDVVFLLLVFFVYAMLAMVLHRGLPVRLPGATSAVTDERDYIAVTITRDNQMFVNEEEVAPDAVGHRVRVLWERDPSRPVYIQGDSESALGLSVGVLDRLREAGIEEVLFATTERVE